MTDINTISNLIKQFDEAPDEELASVLKRINIPIDEFENYASWSKNSYTRNCIARTDDFEFILICWDTNAKTAIHGHDGQDCWVHQVSGKITETRYKNGQDGMTEYVSRDLEKGKMVYMTDKMGFHEIENTSGTRAMTLHVYASPIDECKVVTEDGDIEVRELSYDTNHTTWKEAV